MRTRQTGIIKKRKGKKRKRKRNEHAYIMRYNSLGTRSTQIART